jgi:hypothetical protein
MPFGVVSDNRNPAHSTAGIPLKISERQQYLTAAPLDSRPASKPPSRKTVHEWHERALAAAGLRDMPLHALRHTAALVTS